VRCQGADDVHTLDLTDVYWSGYYISPEWLTVNAFTVPTLSDMGLGLTVRRVEEDVWECTAEGLFEPTRAPQSHVSTDMGVRCPCRAMQTH
jgi:hypothetical protein